MSYREQGDTMLRNRNPLSLFGKEAAAHGISHNAMLGWIPDASLLAAHYLFCWCVTISTASLSLAPMIS